MIKKIIHSKRGSAAIDSIAPLVVMLIATVIFIPIAGNVWTKNQLNTYATELCRTAEMSGRVGEETSNRAREMTQETGLTPEITWSSTGNIQLGEEFTVTCKITRNIGIGGICQLPIPMTGSASGKSEVYWK